MTSDPHGKRDGGPDESPDEHDTLESIPIATPVRPTARPRSARRDPRQGSGPAMTLIGRTIHERYKLKRLVGRGGMGSVFEAEHVGLGRRVAIKLVDWSLAGDPEIASRIKREARSTCSLESEHIVQVFDAGEDPELGLFLAMELLKGEDLEALLARKGPLPQDVAANLVAQAAQGLARAHAAGVVHRDLKPANVFVCAREDGGPLVKLVDFGIAKVLREAAGGEDSALTCVGTVLGTPQYMSPEQALGVEIDHRADVYSLGLVLFEAIAGRPAYPESATHSETLMRVLSTPCPRLSDVVPHVSPELDALCAEMTAASPDERPQEMTVVRERLFAILAGMGASAARSVSVSDDIGSAATVTRARVATAVRAPADFTGTMSEQPISLDAVNPYETTRRMVMEVPSEPRPRTQRWSPHGLALAALLAFAVWAVIGAVLERVEGAGCQGPSVSAAGYAVPSAEADSLRSTLPAPPSLQAGSGRLPGAASDTPSMLAGKGPGDGLSAPSAPDGGTRGSPESLTR